MLLYDVTKVMTIMSFLLVVCSNRMLLAEASTSSSTRTTVTSKSKLPSMPQTTIPRIIPSSRNDDHDENILTKVTTTNVPFLAVRGGSSSSITSRGGGGATGKVATKATATTTTNSAFMDDLVQRLKIGFYFGLWYALNVVYNIVNKKVLNKLPAPLTVGAIQFGVGSLYVILLWLLRLRKTPTLTAYGKGVTRDIGFFHCTGQLLSMVSLGAGPVSFTHIVKALEPFFSALVSAILFGKWMKLQVYLTLLPVVGGVGYACLKERSFSWLAFSTAMGSNLTFALRAVLSKLAMGGDKVGTHITSTNMFGLVTIAAFIISIPIAYGMERNTFGPLWEKATSATVGSAAEGAATTELIQGIVLSGLFHYLNNEVMYLALGNVHPVTLAVGNTMKRVFIMVASVMVFRNPISVQAGIGSGIGIMGVLFYSLTKQYYEKKELEEKEAAAAAAAKKVAGRGRGRN